MSRTAKDEYKIRRESDIKTEVVVELREQNRILFAEGKTLLKALIEQTDLVQGYRRRHLDDMLRAQETDCAIGCDKHVWEDKDGWRRK